VVQIAIDDVTINYDWQCSAEAGLTSFDFANLSLAQTDFDMNLALEEGSGQFLPPAEELSLGYTWQISYTNSLSFTQEAGGTTITATGDMMVDETKEVIGTEPVTLDNGVTADAIQVAQSDTIVLDINVMEQTTTQTIGLSGTYTFAEGIGMVRQTTESDFGGNELVLVSYDIP
jgi:predicted secreted protein